MMKKLLAVVLALAMLLLAVALAEGETAEADAAEAAEPAAPDVSGTWYLVRMTLEGGRTQVPGDMGMLLTLELLRTDNAVVMTDTRGAYQQVDKGIWSVLDDAVIVVIDDEYTLNLRMEGDTLVTRDPSTNSEWVFRREQPAEAYQPAEAAEEVVPEDYNGNWRVSKVLIAGLYFGPEVLDDGPVAALRDADNESAILTMSEAMLFGTSPVKLTYDAGRFYCVGVPEEEEPLPTDTPTPAPPPEEGAGLFVEATPTPPPPMNSVYDITARLLADGTLSLRFDLEGETLATYILSKD